MLILGIESSCDETAAAIVTDDGEVRSDVIVSQFASHAPFGGVVPELASRDHTRNAVPVVRAALAEAGVTLGDVGGIAVTCRPGLTGALLVGVQIAKGIAWGAGKPIVGVDHLVGHLLSAFLKRPDREGVYRTDSLGVPRFPYVALLVSGGHTALYRVDAPDPGAIHELGATRDDAAGEAFDKVGKLLGLGYPGGPAIDRLSEGTTTSLVYEAPMKSRKTLEFSFSGLKTRIAGDVARARAEGRFDDAFVRGTAAAFQRAVVEVLVRKTIAAAIAEGVKDVVLGGGVAANGALRTALVAGACARGLTAHLPSRASCTDNAAMIAYAGAARLVRGESDGITLAATSATSLVRTTRKGGGLR